MIQKEYISKKHSKFLIIYHVILVFDVLPSLKEWKYVNQSTDILVYSGSKTSSKSILSLEEDAKKLIINTKYKLFKLFILSNIKIKNYLKYCFPYYNIVSFLTLTIYFILNKHFVRISFFIFR